MKQKKRKDNRSNDNNTEKPLKKMLDILDVPLKEELSKNNTCLLDQYANLYLVSIPLPNGKEEAEIEDLLPKSVLETEIDGRTFSRKDENKEKFYNKDILANYVMRNYKSIDFSLFRPLLDLIASKC